jgi:hypothetical protein
MRGYNPELIEMREVEEDGHILIELLAIPLGCQRTTTKWLVMVTALLDPVAVSAQSLGALYKMRWLTMNGKELISKGS